MSTALTGSSIVGIVLLILGGLMYWKKKSIKVITWLWVAAGFTLAGSFVSGLQDIIREAAKTAGGPVGLAANVVVGILGCALLWIVWSEVPLRRGKGATAGPGGASGGGKRYTPFLGLAAPMLLLTSTGTLGGWAASIGTTIGKLGGPLATFFGA
jgi:hypothetical protein